MKKIIILVAFCFAFCGFTFAQSSFPELEKVKQITLLESTREDVKKIFKEYAKDAETNAIENIDEEDDEIKNDQISTGNMTIRIFYSRGDCSAEDSDEEWNVPKGEVTEIFILLDDSVKPKDLKIDLSKLERLKIDEDDDDEDDDFLYYDKENGISYRVSNGKIEHIKFIPPEKNYPALCNNENVRQFKSYKEWFRNKTREFWVSYDYRPFANVAELTLSKNEITAYCITKDFPKGEICSEDAEIEIAAKGESADPTDVLTYNYAVSGGKIIGTGATVTWDLTGVKSGKYTITASVDNGCGVCGTTKTQEVVVKECPDCKVKELP
jgi:hypothetical protein